MKSSAFKYIFIVFAILMLVFAIVKIKQDEEKKQKVNQTEETVSNTENIIPELNLGVASFDSINPILSKNKNVQEISKIIFDPLFTVSEDFKIQKCLARELAKQNDNKYIVKLRDNVKWSNGEKFSAEDVKFTIDKIKESQSIYVSNVEHISNIEVVDDTTLRIILDSDIPFFEYNLTFPIISSKFYSDKEFNPDIVPVGTGMYKVTDVQTNALILSKNDNYWDKDKKLTLDTITINLYQTSGELYNAFKIGNVDFISTNNTNISDYVGTIGYLSKEMKGREHDFLALNTQEGKILSNANIRKAILYSIDKKNIVSSIYGDKYYVSSFPLDYGNWVLDNKNEDTKYDLDEAKRTLINDGWTYQYKYWQKTENYKTQKITLNFVVKSSNSSMVAVAENIKAQLEKQGFRINLIKATDSQYSEYMQNKNYDIILCGITLSISPNLNTFFGDNNLANYKNDEVSKLLTEIQNTKDDSKVKEKYLRIAQIYREDVPYISLYTNKYIVLYNTSLVGTMTPNWYNQFYNLEGWHK